MTKRIVVSFFSTLLFITSSNANDLGMGFDGTTDGGWTLINATDGSAAFELIPSQDFAGSGLDGLSFNDLTGGVMYYSAPSSLLAGDFTDTRLNFNYQINSEHDSGSFQINLAGFEDLYINGTAISGFDLIDETILDALQPVTIDFSDAAFESIDLANISSLWIKAEWWGDDVNPSVESHILSASDPPSAPEPDSGLLLISGLFATAVLLRKNKK